MTSYREEANLVINVCNVHAVEDFIVEVVL